VTSVDAVDPSERCVLVLDEDALARTALPLPYPERVVLIARKDPQHLSQAWEAGIVSVVSDADPPSTVLLAIMAAALRVPRLKPVKLDLDYSHAGIRVCDLVAPESARKTSKRSKPH
jgi:hypothetical protein